jgi:hypothetical protein
MFQMPQQVLEEVSTNRRNGRKVTFKENGNQMLHHQALKKPSK